MLGAASLAELAISQAPRSVLYTSASVVSVSDMNAVAARVHVNALSISSVTDSEIGALWTLIPENESGVWTLLPD